MSELRLLTVHAHPDDETIAMGGLLATLADRGVKTSLVCCTDGKLATIYATDMPEATTRPRLAAIRQDELRNAGGILGIGEIHFLEYGDSGMAGAETNQLSDAFWKADLDEVIGKLVAHIRRFRPHVVVTYDANGGYGHPDHIQTHRATVLAVEAAHSALYPEAGDRWQVSKLYYTAFPVSQAHRVVELATAAGMTSPFGDTAVEDLEFATPDDLVTTSVDCRAAIVRKRAAMRAHHSQIAEDFPLLSIPEAMAIEHFGDEHFCLALSRVPVELPESDVFAGIAASVPVTAA